MLHKGNRNGLSSCMLGGRLGLAATWAASLAATLVAGLATLLAEATQSQCLMHYHCLVQHHLADHYQETSMMKHQNLWHPIKSS